MQIESSVSIVDATTEAEATAEAAAAFTEAEEMDAPIASKLMIFPATIEPSSVAVAAADVATCLARRPCASVAAAKGKARDSAWVAKMRARTMVKQWIEGMMEPQASQ